MTDKEQFIQDLQSAVGLLAMWMTEDGDYIVRFTVRDAGTEDTEVTHLSFSKEVKGQILN